MTTSAEKIKCVVIGDGAVGKTCMLITYTQNKFPEEYVPTIFDNYETMIENNESYYQLSLWDTAGQEDYDRMRIFSYPNTQVFLICFSICNPVSLVNVEEKWLKELNEREESRDVPRLLIGCKSDARNDEQTIEELKKMGKEMVKYEDAMEIVKKEENNISGYVECSALERLNLDRVFEAAVEAAMEKGSGPKIQFRAEGKNSKNCCQIL